MKFEIAEDSKPQVKLLILATVVSIAIWFASWYFPFADYVVYPLQLFATFVHEGSHVLASLMTGGSVQSMTVSPDTSGAVMSATNSWLSQVLTSSAGLFRNDVLRNPSSCLVSIQVLIQKRALYFRGFCHGDDTCIWITWRRSGICFRPM